MTFLWPENHRPIVLVGPTATGKTAVAIELAERLNGEIVNADSMQIYRGMDIGTAKPDSKDRARVKFHLLDLVTPDQPFSVADWKSHAESAITDIASRGRQPIVCGGTGLYVRALLEDWSLAGTPADSVVREALQAEAASQGAPALYMRLQETDPITAARLHPNDTLRIIRALEVYQVTGRPISEYRQSDLACRQNRPAYRLGLTLTRPELYKRIELRVDAMFAAGWEEEVRRLLEQGYDPALNPLKSLGYKEIIQYLLGELDETTTLHEIKQNTRRFAKRQQTWFRADSMIAWCDVSVFSSATVAITLITQLQQTGAF